MTRGADRADGAGKPPYVVHEVREEDVTVDWFFGAGRSGRKLVQLVLVLVGWFFAVLPVVVTTSALVHRNDESGWWDYHEGFVMWRTTMILLGILLVVFAVGFLTLFLLDRHLARHRNQVATYDEERLAERLEIAGEWYAQKFGPAGLRHQQRRVQIEPYGDIETYELRGRYRSLGVE